MNDRMRQLMWATQALAQPAEVQVKLFPDYVCKLDELLLDFDNWRQAVVGNERDQLTPDQHAALDALDASFGQLTLHPECQSELDQLQLPQWTTVRQLATAVLTAFGWPDEAPPTDRSIYIQGRRS